MLGYFSGITGTYAYQFGAKLVVARRSGEVWLEREVSPSSIGYYFAECPDLHGLEVASPAALKATAISAWRANRAVMLFGLLFEIDETFEDTREVAVDLDQMLKDEPLRQRVSRLLHASSMSKPYDHARLEAALVGLEFLSPIFNSIRDSQYNIQALLKAFDGLAPELFDDKWSRVRVRDIAVAEGCFYALAKAEVGTAGFEFAVLEATKGLRIVPNKSAIISHWLRDFRSTKKRETSLMQAEHHSDYSNDFVGSDATASYAAFQNALAQQNAIVEKLRKGEIEVARKYVDDLVRSQLVTSTPDQVSKSLCRLSQRAKQFQIFTLQYEWALRATEVYPEDAWAHGQVADSLILLNRLVEAKVALDQAEINGDPGYAAVGRARILRARGHLSEALKQYTDARDGASTDEDKLHAWVGMASVLREMGKTFQSLKEIRECLKEFATEDRAWTAYALALLDSGDMSQALSALARVSNDSADFFHAQYAKASVFRAVGNAQLAEREFKNLAKSYPSSPLAACGFATALAANGKSDLGVQELKSAQQRYPYSPEPFIALVEVLSDQGKRAEALKVLENGLELFPDEPRLSVSFAKFAYKFSDPSEALSAIDKLANDRPDLIFVRLDRAKLLWRAGLRMEALAALDQILSQTPDHRAAKNAKASLLIDMGHLVQAIRLLDVSTAQSEDDWRAIALRAMCTVEQGSSRGLVLLQQIQTKVPFVRQKRIVSAMIASLKIRNRRPTEAIRAVKHVNWDVSAVVRLHALAQGGRKNLARQAYEKANVQSAELIELRDEIARRYNVIDEPAKYDGKWILQRERSAILQEAA